VTVHTVTPLLYALVVVSTRGTKVCKDRLYWLFTVSLSHQLLKEIDPFTGYVAGRAVFPVIGEKKQAVVAACSDRRQSGFSVQPLKPFCFDFLENPTKVAINV